MRRSSEKCSGSARLATSANVGGATAGLRDVVDLERPAGGRAGRLVPQRPAEDAVELARRDPAPPVLGDPRRRREHAARCPGPSSPRSAGSGRSGRTESGSRAPGGSRPPSPPRACPARSHLFARSTRPLPSFSAYEATLASWPVGPSLASTTSSATSHSSMRLRACMTDSTSGPCSVRPRRRIPAVSTRRKRWSPRVEGRVDGVARRAGDLRDDRARLAQERVEERGLADVGAARRPRPRSRAPRSRRRRLRVGISRPAAPPTRRARPAASRSRPGRRRRRCRARPTRPAPRRIPAPRPRSRPRCPRGGRSCWRRRCTPAPPRARPARPRGLPEARPPRRPSRAARGPRRGSPRPPSRARPPGIFSLPDGS